MGWEDGRLKKLSQNSFQEQVLLLAILKSRFLPPSTFQARGY